jgi:hypothetical protein
MGEICTGGQREQDGAQLKACEQLQNRSQGGDVNDFNGNSFIDIASQIRHGWTTNHTMVIPGTNVNTTYIPPPATGLGFMCYNFQVTRS